MDIKILEKINGILDKEIKWAIFGGVAVAVYNGDFFRKNSDIDIIIENNDEKIKKIKEIFEKRLYNFESADRKGRKKYLAIIEDYRVEFMVMTGKNEIALANGKFSFDSIKTKKFKGVSLRVIDLQSLRRAKISHKESLKNDSKHTKILYNTLKDIAVLNRLKVKLI